MEINPVPCEINQELKSRYSGGIFGESPNFIQVGNSKWLFPERYQTYAEKYKNFEARPDDVWVIGYPRSGTSVTADICWLITHGIDFESAKIIPFNERSKLFELNTLFGEESRHVTDEKVKTIFKSLFTCLEEEQEKRVIKTHLPYELLPSNLLTCGAKVIYIARNVKDIALSFYNLQKTPTRENFQGTFEDFWNCMENNLLTFTPYWKHLQQGFAQKHNKNVLVIFYEEQTRDLKNGIKKISDFLEVSLTDQQLNSLTEHFTFDNYKKVTSGKNFFNDNFEHVRKGKVGGWKKEFPEELIKQADKWIRKNAKSINIKCEDYYILLD